MIINTLIYTIKRELRDKVSLLLMILFPIILVLIVGTSLKSDFEAPPFEKANIAIIDSDRGNYSEVLTNVFNEEKIKTFVNVDTDIKTLDEAKKNYENKDIDAYIEIPKGYTANLNEGKSDNIILTESGDNSQKINIVKQILDQFTSRLNILKMQEVDYEDIQVINDIFKENMISNVGVGEEHIPTSMDYYGVTLIILICLYGSLYNVRMISDTLQDECGLRLSTITNKKYKIETGITLASLIFVAIQILFLVGIFKFGYKVYYGDNAIGIVLLLGSLILFSNSMGRFFIKLFRNYNLTYTALNVLILGMTFLSSGFVILNLGNGAFANIVESYLPNALCQNALFSIIYNTNSVTIGQAISTILIETLILLIVPILFKRKESVL